MKYKGKEIGKEPTLEMIVEYIEYMGFDLDAKEIYDHYKSKGWLTIKHKPLKTVESMVNAFNGKVIWHKYNNGEKVEKKTKKKNKTPKQEKKERSDYYELLKDPRWQKRRLEIMQRDNFTCQMCGNGLTSGVPLNVHHYVYHKGYLPWEYPDKDLITLCRDCHHKLHEDKPNTSII